MEIKVGFEISYAAVQPTPMVIMLSIHPSRFSDIVGTEQITAGPDVPIGFYLGPADAFIGMEVSINVVSVGDEQQVEHQLKSEIV